MTDHQVKQIEVINKIEEQVKNNSLNFSTVSAVEDFTNDPRICLTSVHIPHKELTEKIGMSLIQSLRAVAPNHFYYPQDSLHMTIKGIRFVYNPPNFTQEDIEKAKEVFAETIPIHKKFQVYFYRLLLFPTNVALIGTTDEELDNIIFDLDKKLTAVGLPDDKSYINDRSFFSNITLLRFTESISEEFKQQISKLSDHINFSPYTVDSISLVTCNAVFKKRQILDTWTLKS